jgi:chemotaxis protein methyltransferase CheR
MNHDFLRFRRSVIKLCGLELENDERAALIRLARLMRAFKVASFAELADMIDRGADADLIGGVIDAIVTTRTEFFGDRLEFERFRLETLPRLKGRRARIWCAGCATGQEAYSLAMTLAEEAPTVTSADVEILATDISCAALETARLGLYSQFEVQRGLSAARLLRHFDQRERAWRVKDAVRSRVFFKEFNLLDDVSQLGRFDVIFCRNVLSDFEESAGRDALARLSSALTENGVLFLGSSESFSVRSVMRTNAARRAMGRRPRWDLSASLCETL